MATVVKSHKRKGKVVKGHTRGTKKGAESPKKEMSEHPMKKGKKKSC